jgi:hypothetical protein
VPTRLHISFYGDEQLDRTLEAIELRAQDASPAWQVLADRFLDIEERQFATQGAYGSGGWSPLSPKYAAWKARHYPGAPILVRTGELRDSLTNGPDIRVITRSAMAVGSGVDHGLYHQRGDGVPQRRPIEFPEDERQHWVHTLHRFLVTGRTA